MVSDFVRIGEGGDKALETIEKIMQSKGLTYNEERAKKKNCNARSGITKKN